MPPAPDDVARFLAVADVAEMLAITPAEVMDLVRAGELPAIRVAGAWRVERVVLESFIEAGYEETRRMALWRQSQDASLPEIAGGRILPPRTED